MKKLKLKPVVKKTILATIFTFCLLLVLVPKKEKTASVSKNEEDYTYVNDYIFDNYYPVINSDEKLMKPYNSEKVTILKNFYDKEDSEDKQQNSIIYYENIYMQNSGIDYKSDEEFDIVSVSSGTVTKITTDNMLGKTIEVRNTDGLIFMYQCLGNELVKNGDTLTQGQIISKSGTCSLNANEKYTLHFEMYKDGTVINPEKYFDKSILEIGQ